MVQNGKLNMRFSYDSSRYEKNIIEKLANEYEKNLSAIVEYCSNIVSVEFTPSDFDVDSLDIEDLDNLLENL